MKSIIENIQRDADWVKVLTQSIWLGKFSPFTDPGTLVLRLECQGLAIPSRAHTEPKAPKEDFVFFFFFSARLQWVRLGAGC